MSYAPRNDTWVEKRIDQVEDERRESNAEDDNEYNALHQEIVRALNSLEQQRADARVTEHDLDKRGAGYQLTEHERKCGGLRKHRVSYAVVDEYGAILQTFRLGEGDIILALRGHHHGAHAERPAAQLAEDYCQRRQNGVSKNIQGEGKTPLWNRSRRVAPVERKQLHSEADDIDEHEPKQKKRHGAHGQQGRHEQHEPPRRPGPCLKRAENIANDKGKDGRHREKGNRPRQPLEDHVADPARIAGDRVVEIEASHVGQKGNVLLPERLGEAEFLFILLDHALHADMQIASQSGLLHDFLGDRVLAAESWQEEIDRRREPNDQKENPNPLYEVEDWHALSPSRQATREGLKSSPAVCEGQEHRSRGRKPDSRKDRPWSDILSNRSDSWANDDRTASAERPAAPAARSPWLSTTDLSSSSCLSAGRRRLHRRSC